MGNFLKNNQKSTFIGIIELIRLFGGIKNSTLPLKTENTAMQKKIKIKSIFVFCILIVVLLLLTNCKKPSPAHISVQPSKDPISATQTIQAILNDLYTETPLPTNTSSPTSTLTITPTPRTPYPTSTPYATLIPLPTVVNKEAYLHELMQTNGGCQLPCFWGITPGETSYLVADQFLTSFATEKYVNGSFFSYEFYETSDEFVNPIYTYISMTTKDDLVYDLSIGKNVKGSAPWKRAQFISVEKVLQELGQPSNVFIYVNIAQMELWSSYLILTYDEEHIFFTYLTSHADTYEDGIICYGSDPRIEIGYPKDEIRINDIFSYVNNEEYYQRYKTIDEITNMTTETFTGVTDPETGDFCFELDYLDVLDKNK